MILAVFALFVKILKFQKVLKSLILGVFTLFCLKISCILNLLVSRGY